MPGLPTAFVFVATVVTVTAVVVPLRRRHHRRGGNKTKDCQHGAGGYR
jgi:hypothetical protein